MRDKAAVQRNLLHFGSARILGRPQRSEILPRGGALGTYDGRGKRTGAKPSFFQARTHHLERDVDARLFEKPAGKLPLPGCT